MNDFRTQYACVCVCVCSTQMQAPHLRASKLYALQHVLYCFEPPRRNYNAGAEYLRSKDLFYCVYGCVGAFIVLFLSNCSFASPSSSLPNSNVFKHASAVTNVHRALVCVHCLTNTRMRGWRLSGEFESAKAHNKVRNGGEPCKRGDSPHKFTRCQNS